MNKKYDFENMSELEIRNTINNMEVMEMYFEEYFDENGNQRTRIRRMDNDKVLSDCYTYKIYDAWERLNIKYRYQGINPVMCQHK